MYNQSLIEKALPQLQCPHCKDNSDLKLATHTLACSTCLRKYSIRNGIIDFIPDFPSINSLSQRAMENALYVKLYEKYLRPAFTSLGSNISYKDEDSWLSNYSKTCNAVLDLASGTGRYSRILADQLNAKIVFSIDISRPMLEQAVIYNKKQGYNNILNIRADAHNLPLKTDSIDFLNCFGALHLMPNTQLVVKELSRVGLVDAFFTCLTAGIAENTLARRIQTLFSKTGSFQFFAPKKLAAILANNGFADFKYEMHNMVMLCSATLYSTRKEASH